MLDGLDGEQRFGRKLWGLLSLELWQRAFHDREAEFKKLLIAPGDPHSRPAPAPLREASTREATG